MSELRQDITTREWVIISTERAKRPHEFASAAPKEGADRLPEFSEKCPFCPGHEEQTPEEVFMIPGNGGEDSPYWQARVVPNKFHALDPQEELGRGRENSFRSISGFGYHEVVIETPVHNRDMALMEMGEIKQVLCAYRARHETLRKDTRVQLIVIFKNHGRAAGTSLEHPHSQIVAVPVIPGGVRSRIQEAQRYYDDNGRCVYCAMMEDELSAQKRIVMQTEHFVVFQPYASRVPFETWIMPRRHATSFGLVPEDECNAVAPIIRDILAKIYHGLRNPDFNLMVRTAPVEYEDAPYYHWHIEIFPRLSLQAGFELGSGIYINASLPEENAAFLREVEV